MIDERFYTDTYDLHRPIVSTSDSGEQSLTIPSTPTTADQPCRFFPGRGQSVQEERGVNVNYDAVMHVPFSHDIRPAQEGQQPDIVAIGGRHYVVLGAWDLGGMGYDKRVLLQEKPA